MQTGLLHFLGLATIRRVVNRVLTEYFSLSMSSVEESLISIRYIPLHDLLHERG